MACHLFGAKPLPEPVLTSQFDMSLKVVRSPAWSVSKIMQVFPRSVPHIVDMNLISPAWNWSAKVMGPMERWQTVMCKMLVMLFRPTCVVIEDTDPLLVVAGETSYGFVWSTAAAAPYRISTMWPDRWRSCRSRTSAERHSKAYTTYTTMDGCIGTSR